MNEEEIKKSDEVATEENKSEESNVPVITFNAETKRLLDVRKIQKGKKPTFKQSDSHKKKKLADYWRKPRGIHNKTRYGIKGKCPLVKAGYGSPSLVRGLHPSGCEEVLVRNTKDIEPLNAGRQAARIAHTVGLRKRMLIEKKAAELGLKILNPTRSEEE